MKTIALYLPQFHRTPENDQWWGDGYTEWTAVKNAETLYEGHYQPRLPLNMNFYDLLKKETMEWQAEMMKKYHVHGLCFYHYYFQNGRKILEQPAENLLKWQDIDMPFCFSWANESWARTWSNLQDKNSWNIMMEKGQGVSEDGILLRQEYGGEKEWEEHFYYLLPFFRDSRYLKIDGKPIFLVYRPDSIPCMDLMMGRWNELARENQMDGMYFIATNTRRSGYDAYLNQEPGYTLNYQADFIMEASDICARVVMNAADSADSEKNVYYCGFSGYDDTPRRGNQGLVIEDLTPDRFYQMMVALFIIGARVGNEFTFVNAWNEWGEGMYLEPDEKNGYGYLEALSKAFSDYKNIALT